MIVSPTALGRLLRPSLVGPTALAALLGGQEAFQQFRGIVRELFPDDWQRVFDAREPAGTARPPASGRSAAWSRSASFHSTRATCDPFSRNRRSAEHRGMRGQGG